MSTQDTSVKKSTRVKLIYQKKNFKIMIPSYLSTIERYYDKISFLTVQNIDVIRGVVTLPLSSTNLILCVFLYKVFVNGDMVQEVKGQGFLSQDWGGKAGIGMRSLNNNILITTYLFKMNSQRGKEFQAEAR